MNKKFFSIVIAIVLVLTASISVVALAEEPTSSRLLGEISVDEAKLGEYIASGANASFKIEKNSKFMFDNSWALKEQEITPTEPLEEGEEPKTETVYNVDDIRLVFPHFRETYTVEEETKTYEDKLYIVCYTPNATSWTSYDVLSNGTFSATTDGYYSFRYKVEYKDETGKVIDTVYSKIIKRYTQDTTAPTLSVAIDKEKSVSATSAFTVTLPSFDDASSVNKSYVIYKKVNGNYIPVYDSLTGDITTGYEDCIAEGGIIKALTEDILSGEDKYMYKIVFDAVDVWGNKIDASEEELTQYVYVTEKTAEPTNPDDNKKVVTAGDVWKIVLIVIASLSAIGIVVLLFVKPAEEQPEGRIHYGAENIDEESEVEPEQEPEQPTEEPAVEPEEPAQEVAAEEPAEESSEEPKAE